MSFQSRKGNLHYACGSSREDVRCGQGGRVSIQVDGSRAQKASHSDSRAKLGPSESHLKTNRHHLAQLTEDEDRWLLSSKLICLLTTYRPTISAHPIGEIRARKSYDRTRLCGSSLGDDDPIHINCYVCMYLGMYVQVRRHKIQLEGIFPICKSY